MHALRAALVIAVLTLSACGAPAVSPGATAPDAPSVASTPLAPATASAVPAAVAAGRPRFIEFYGAT